MSKVLQRRHHKDVVYYASPLLERIGVPHAFSTRLGGISAAPFDSLNLGNPSGCDVQDEYETIYANYRRLQRAIGHEHTQRIWVHQVHGGAVAVVRAGETFESGAKADALVSDDPQRLMAVRVADCVPILMATEDGAVVAAVHAGWRGVIGGVVPAAVGQMNNLHPGATACNIVAAIGPCISMEHFEVGPEVLDAFAGAFGGSAPIRRHASGKGQVDLRRAVEMQLLQAGLSPQQIDTTDRCTYRDAEEFFSHRRDKGLTGRMAALIAAKEAACPGDGVVS